MKKLVFVTLIVFLLSLSVGMVMAQTNNIWSGYGQGSPSSNVGAGGPSTDPATGANPWGVSALSSGRPGTDPSGRLGITRGPVQRGSESRLSNFCECSTSSDHHAGRTARFVLHAHEPQQPILCPRLPAC